MRKLSGLAFARNNAKRESWKLDRVNPWVRIPPLPPFCSFAGFEGVVGLDSFTNCSVPLVVRLASIARENYTRR